MSETPQPPHPPGPGGYPPGTGGYPYPPYQPPPPYNTYAILALALAVFVLPPLGIYFGSVAKKQIAVTGERGIEIANVAVIVGWVLTAIIGVFFVIWCGFVLAFAGGFGAVNLR